MVTKQPGTRTGEREGPQAGEGAGQAGAEMLPASSSTPPAKPCVSPGHQHGAAAHGASISPRLVAGYTCMGVIGCSSRTAATSRAAGKNHSRSQAGFGLCGRTDAKPTLVCKCSLPALPPRCHPTDPKGTTAIPFCSPRPQAPLASTLSWSPSTAERTTPGALGAEEPQAVGNTEVLMALPADA